MTKMNLEKPDIAEIVSQYTNLRPVGKHLRGLCPFHAERTPSFFIRPYSQTFACYGCGIKGDVIEFIIKIKNLDFKSACKHLGIELKPRRKTKREILKKELLRKFKSWCRDYFHDLASLYRTLQIAKKGIKSVEEAEKLTNFYHEETLWLYRIEVLLGNDDGPKLELFKEVTYGN